MAQNVRQAAQLTQRSAMKRTGLTCRLFMGPPISNNYNGVRAECIMLNKGPCILQANRTLDAIL